MAVPSRRSAPCTAAALTLALTLSPAYADAFDAKRHAVSVEHPRLLGSRERLQTLAAERGDAFARMSRVARATDGVGIGPSLISKALVSAVEEDAELGRTAVELALTIVDSPIRSGHVTFGYDQAYAGLVYDLCHEYWTDEERSRFHTYVNATFDANVTSETSPMHNAYYGYKWHGIGLAAYAAYYENDRAPELLAELEEEYRTRAAPTLELAGGGGGWAEGYYINYWLYEWLFFCEVARFCEGVDYYSLAPGFYENRAVAGMFEALPGIRIYDSRRPIPMGDGGGRTFGGDRDKALSSRRILVNRFRDDRSHRAVHAFDETTPCSSVGNYAYKDFLWRDTTVAPLDLSEFKLSHYSPGAGYAYARSSWEEDATHFFFKSGDRFTSHQHLDVGHFLIYKRELLAGDGGHYDDFASQHAVDYYVRTIAHNTVLVRDPAATWPSIRGHKTTGNDGGQHHDWPHHNGNVEDATAWQRGCDLYDIADFLAYEDHGDYLYVAGDASRAYPADTVDYFTRQIVYIRPGTFVIFDRVRSTDPDFRKTWLLQAMKPPVQRAPHLIIDNGDGRLFVQTVLPPDPLVNLAAGDDQYSYGGHSYPPGRITGPAPECRIEISPATPSAEDIFLHVLTATETAVDSVPEVTAVVAGETVTVEIGDRRLSFAMDAVAMTVEMPTAVERTRSGGLPGEMTARAERAQSVQQWNGNPVRPAASVGGRAGRL